MLNGFSNRMPHNNEGVAKNLFSKFKQTLQDRLKWWSSVNNNDNSSTTSTLDWRSLSPDKPPLPFFLPNDSNYSPSSSTSDLFHQTTLIPITDIIEVNQKYTKVSTLTFYPPYFYYYCLYLIHTCSTLCHVFFFCFPLFFSHLQKKKRGRILSMVAHIFITMSLYLGDMLCESRKINDRSYFFLFF
jgi:hypothetical protein